MTALLRIAGAAPYLLLAFMNAFVDTGHKKLIEGIVFKTIDGPLQTALMSIVNGLILLPFILLFTPAGFVGDRFAKTSVIRASAFAAVVLSLGITLAYYQGWFAAAFAMTFLLAAQSAFYSPAKYGYLKLLFGKQNIGAANGAVQAITIIAILASLLSFAVLIDRTAIANASPGDMLQGLAWLGWVLVLASLLELGLSFFLPARDAGNPGQRFDWQAYRTGRLFREYLARLRGRTVIQLSILGLAIFWSISQVLAVVFRAWAEDAYGIDDLTTNSLTLACGGIGIALGSIFAGRVSRDHIETGLIPLGAGGIALGLWLLPGLESVLAQRLCFLFLGTMGATFIVPLNALIQFSADSRELGRVLAASNWFQNVAMLGFLLLTALLASLDLDGRFMLTLLAVIATAGGLYTVYRLPQSLVRYVLASLFRRRYRIRVQGLNNIPETGGLLLLGNHVSWVDWAIVQIACPRRVRFVMAREYYDRWYLKWLLELMGCVPIQPGASSGAALETVAELLDAGHTVCLFPEGSITRTGQLAEFRRGYESAIQGTSSDVVIVPFYLRGLWGSQFSRSSEGLKRRRASGFRRELIVSFGAPLSKDTPSDILKRRVFDLSILAWQVYANSLPTIPAAWIETAKRMGRGRLIVDPVSGELSADRALAGAIAFSRRIARISPEQNVGLLLPVSAGGALANMAAFFAGKTVVNLNFTASDEALASAIAAADIRTVYTSRRFLERLGKRGRNLDAALERLNVVLLEDLRAGIGRFEQIATWLMGRLLPSAVLTAVVCRARDPAATAIVLFSSGSEGRPKGVMLSHRNVMINANQIVDALNVQEDDLVLASLPLFHAFGLNAMTIMPLVTGIPIACHPDPTDVVGIAKSVAAHRATIMCSTSSFLRLFLRNPKVEPPMLASLRVVVAGAEPLNIEIRDAFQARFGGLVLEGYGCTETSPVAGANLPDAIDQSSRHVQAGNRPGTIGMPVHGTSFRVVDPETFEELPTDEEGMILIGGPQVMQGYLGEPEKTAQAVREIDGTRWFVTGDKGSLDADGFLTIRDRYSRFAKIAGEMVSLGEVEQAIRASLGDAEIDLVALNFPDDRKGEAVVVLHEGEIDARAVEKAMLAAGVPGLMIPSRWFSVDTIPKLGSGKTDFVAARAVASAALGEDR
jgi:acyl-[acyl-carrier-protein]-phospholipid O-acyltransferase/long-chain-fatty-acid--[acyl-carrier-protein] ligase